MKMTAGIHWKCIAVKMRTATMAMNLGSERVVRQLMALKLG